MNVLAINKIRSWFDLLKRRRELGEAVPSVTEIAEANDSPSEPGSKATGSLTWLGWQESAEEAPQPVSILYGRNIRK
jgi:hypothetical protein